MNVNIRTVSHESAGWALSIALRTAVLREPLGLFFTEQELEEEDTSYHLTAWEGELLVGCLVLLPIDAFTVKMRQVAVRPDKQGLGIGKLLVQYAEALAKEHLFESIRLHARESAFRFYDQLGYVSSGDIFEEVGIPHKAYSKKLG
jgi:predicted GNAT family N-acyltransferase